MGSSRISGLLLAFALVAAACSGETTSTTTTDQPESTSTTPAADSEVVEWDEDFVEAFIDLEGDGWTVETALEAAALVRAELERGVTEVHGTDLGGLATYLIANFDDVPEDDWSEILGWETATAGRRVLFQIDEPTRQVFQNGAERVDADFESLTGHRLNIPMHVALSDYDKPMGLSAATFVAGDRLEGFQFLFRSQAAWQAMADAVAPLAASSGEVCVMVYGQQMVGWGGDRQAAALMHEVTHCHQHQVHPQGAFGFRSSRVDWMDEGYASWAGESYVGGTSISKPWWDGYFDRRFGSDRDSFNVFTGSYQSFTFFVMLERGGIDNWGNFVPWFNGLRANNVTNPARLQSMLGGINTNVAVGWTASATRNGDFGSPWDSENGIGSSQSSRFRNPTPQRVLGESTVRAVEGQQRYRLMQVQTAPDVVSLITVAAEGLGTYRWQDGDWSEQFLVNGSYEMSWCVGEDCTCEDGSSPAPGVQVAPIQAGDNPDLHAAMFGTSRAAELTVTVQTLEDACEEEEELPTGPLDACLFGTWNPDPEQFQELVLRQYRSFPGVSNLTLDGTIDLVFNDDGTFAHNYNGVAGSATVGGQTINATWTGGNFGNWEAANGLLTLHFLGTNIVVTVGPTTAPAAPIPRESVDAPYECGPTQVSFVPPDTFKDLWPLPEDWTKVG